MFRRYAIVAMDDMEAALAKQEQYEQKALTAKSSPADIEANIVVGD
jgi:hypothetical protein